MPFTMPLLGLGSYGWGGRVGERNESDRDVALGAVQIALDIGYRLFDTAEVYGSGLSEECIGVAIKEYSRRELCIVSKVWKDHLTGHGIREALAQSLKRLGTNYLDVYLVHWPSDTIPLSETMPAMEALVTQGLVRAIGVSNFSVAQMEEASQYLHTTKLAVNEIEYNVTNQSAEIDVIPYCQTRNIQVIAYRPLAKGALVTHDDARLDEMAKKYHKTRSQIALNWLLSQNITAIPKASSEEHLLENWGALGWSLAPEDQERLRATT